MRQHTPKPWMADTSKLSGHLLFPIRDTDGQLIGGAYFRDTVDSARPESRTAEGQPEAAANARLMAAAPDLLAACIELVRVWDFATGIAVNASVKEATLHQGRSAIVKAEGEQ